jgi:SM-20-related protein
VTDDIVAALAGPGWGVFDDFLSRDETAALRAEGERLRAAGRFHRAGVGRGKAALRDDIRGDEVCWIEPGVAGAASDALLARFESLRLKINRALMLGLFDAELHYARYAPGAGYRRHLDRFRDDDRRTLTLIVYLNIGWRPQHGGQLRFWPSTDQAVREIPPRGGTLVAFLSDRFWHEVAPARHERWSVTGWYRRR